MLKISGTRIELTRGDTMRVHIDLTYQSGTAYTPAAGDSIRFAMKKRYKDETCVILKDIPIATMILELDPEDTKDLGYGEYVYDIQMTFANGDIDTFIDKAMFVLTEEVE